MRFGVFGVFFLFLWGGRSEFFSATIMNVIFKMYLLCSPHFRNHSFWLVRWSDLGPGKPLQKVGSGVLLTSLRGFV